MALVYKKSEDGKMIHANDAGNPIVFDDEKGDESIMGLDAIDLYVRVGQQKNTIKQLKEAGEKVKGITKHFEGIEDPDKYLTTAKTAMQIMQDLKDGKVIKKDELEAIKTQAEENLSRTVAETEKKYQDMIEKLKEANASDGEFIHKMLISDNFYKSKFVAEKLNLSPKGAQRYFHKNFIVEEIETDDGKKERIPVGYFDDGTKVYSRSAAGKIAPFEEAIQLIVEKSDERERLLKGRETKGNDTRTGNDYFRSGDGDAKTPVDKIAAGLAAME